MLPAGSWFYKDAEARADEVAVKKRTSDRLFFGSKDLEGISLLPAGSWFYKDAEARAGKVAIKKEGE